MDKVIVLDGIPNDDAHWMIKCIQEAIDEVKRLQKVRKLLKTLNTSLQAAVQWADSAKQKCKDQLKTHGWLTSEFTASLQKSKPSTHLDSPEQLLEMKMFAEMGGDINFD